MELELAWGFHDIADTYPHLSPERREETKRLKQVLAICDDHSIPFSFDVVGYLLNERYRSNEDSPHDSDWLPVSPGSDVDSDPLFYAPDLVDAIRAASTEHEICSHTYTHSILGDSTDDVVRWELEMAKEAHEAFGLTVPESLVPPRHSEPESALLTEHGFSVMRSAVAVKMPSNVKKFAHFLTRSVPVRFPDSNDGVVSTYCTPNPSLTGPFFRNGQRPAHPTFRVIPRSVKEKLHRRLLTSSLEEAIETDSYVHYWTHLFNLSNDVQWPIVRDFLAELHRQRERGQVEFAVMKELAAGADE